MMEFRRATLKTCAQAAGLVVVIDVLRAFTTAAFAFEAGTAEIYLVREVEEALALRQQMPGALVMGEVGGLPPDGFDYGNSPAALIGLQLTGRRIIQRTGAGTQGVVLSAQADPLLAASFVCAQATVRMIQTLAPDRVTFVITGQRPAPYDDGFGDEDAACADYLEALLSGQNPDVSPYLERVRRSRDAAEDARSFPTFAADMECCVAVDRVPFAMRVERRDGLHVMKPVQP
jgi:2-phosphosulfolactate phosphatase